MSGSSLTQTPRRGYARRLVPQQLAAPADTALDRLQLTEDEADRFNDRLARTQRYMQAAAGAVREARMNQRA